MRILVTSGHRDVVGGTEKYIRNLVPALLARGHQVGVLYEHNSRPGESTVDPPDADLPLWFWSEFERDETLQLELAKWNPDIVYSNGFQSGDLEQFLLDRFPMVMYAHVYQGTCITGRKCFAFPVLEPCHRHFGPECLAMYYPRRCGGLNPWSAWQAYQLQSKRNARLHHYRSVLVASAHMYEEFRRHGLDQHRLHLVPLPYTDQAPQPSPPTPKPIRGRVLFVGRFTDLKGIAYLIQAIPRAAALLSRPLALTVAGDGSERTRVEELARRVGGDTAFVGWVDPLRRHDLMQASDLLAVPSVWPEPFGLVGIEAGGLGLPAVGYNVGGIPDWLKPGESGELAPGDPPTVDGLAQAMARALAAPAHYARLCRGAWEVANRFTLEAHLTALEAVLCAEKITVPSH